MYSIDKSHSENLDARRLLKSDELRKLKEGEMIVVRVIKRKNKEGDKIVPNPIFNNGDYCMKYRYEYLVDTFNNATSFISIKVKSLHNDLELKDIDVNFDEILNEFKRKRKSKRKGKSKRRNEKYNS